MGTQWIKCEVKEEQLPALAEEIQHQILQKKAVELLPYYGLLYLKDKIWHGKIFLMKQTAIADEEGSNEDKRMSAQSSCYLFEIFVKIDEEMQHEAASEDVGKEKYYTVLYICGGDDNERISKMNEKPIQSLSEYLCKSVISNDISNENKRFHLMVLRREFFQNIQKFFKDKFFKFSRHADAFFAVLLDDSSVKYQSVPCKIIGYEIKKMTVEETLFAVRQWKFSSIAGEFRFANSCKLGLAFGAFPIGSDTPVCWAMVSWDGAIAALQTLSGHRGKGIAKSLIKNISSEMMKINLTPFVFIENVETSVVPVSLFTSIGFEVFRDVSFQWSSIVGPSE